MPTEPDLAPPRTQPPSRWAAWRAGTTTVIVILGLLVAWAALVPHG